MSKPVTNEEVEDVLSSIRRLVSEDKRPLAGLRSASTAPVTAQPETPQPETTIEPIDRFVLTPALRVMSKEDDSPTELDEGPLDLGSVTQGTWGSTIDADEPLEDDDRGSDLPMKSSPLDAADNIRTDTLVQNPQVFETQEADDGDYSAEEYWGVEEAPSHDLGEAIVKKEDAFDWDMDAPETEPNDVDQPEGIEGAEERSLEEKFFEPERNDSTEKLGQVTSAVPLTAKIAALEAAVGELASGWEPDGDEIETLAATVAPAMAWEDDLQLDAMGAPLKEEAIEKVTEVEAEAALAHSLLYLCLLLRLKLSLTRVHHVTHVAVHALAFFLLILLLADSHDLSHLLLV